MNICLVSQEYPPETPWGGIGTQTRIKAHGLARLGHNVHVLTRSADEGSDLRIEAADGITVHRMQPPGYEFPIYGRCAYMIGYAWGVLRQLDRIMKEVRFDIVDFPEFGGEGIAYQLDRTCWNWAPVAVHLHGSLAMFVEFTGWPDPSTRFYRYGSFAEETSIREADGLLASSASHADLVCRRYGVPRESIEVVHCGVDADLFNLPAPEARPAARPTVLFVGNIVENKGIQTVVKAVISLLAKYPDIRLQVVGRVPRGPDLINLLRAWIEAANAQDNVEFAGFVAPKDLPAYYKGADVFCSPADFEGGAASVYLEAMGCGCPVIASASGGGAETVTHEETGLLVPPNDVAATAEAIDRILGDPAFHRRIARAARERIDEYFSIDKYALRVQAAYEKIIAHSLQKPQRHEDVRE
jgi:glycosyltransferase involved in cell wall biosynthesis